MALAPRSSESPIPIEILLVSSCLKHYVNLVLLCFQHFADSLHYLALFLHAQYPIFNDLQTLSQKYQGVGYPLGRMGCGAINVSRETPLFRELTDNPYV